jgi:hypothetical protein
MDGAMVRDGHFIIVKAGRFDQAPLTPHIFIRNIKSLWGGGRG